MSHTFAWKRRHTVLTILFVAWIIAFIDRMAVSVALPSIANDYHLTPLEMGAVLSIFFFSYSISQIPGGLLADKFGPRKVATMAMLWWSAFTGLTGLAANLTQLLVVRFVFGIGEGALPGCTFKTIALWFPKAERAAVAGTVLASNFLGAALAPLVVVGILTLGGWRVVFYSLLLPGLLVSALFWLLVPEGPSNADLMAPDRSNVAESANTRARGVAASCSSFFLAVKQPNMLNYFLILFTFDSSYWGFTTWLPTYLTKVRGFSLAQMGIAASLPFFAGALGSALGGLASDKYFRNAPKQPIVCTQILSALLLGLTYLSTSLSAFFAYQTLAGFFMSASLACIWALPMRTLSEASMGAMAGFLNMAAEIAAFTSPLVIGLLVELAGGKFGLTFEFLVASLLISCGIVLATSDSMP